MGTLLKNDPQRPLRLAIRSTRILGIALLLISMVMVLPMAFLMRTGLGMPSMVLAIIATAFYIGPGVMYLLCAIFMKRRKTWAVIVALVLASLHLLSMSFFGISLLVGINPGPGQEPFFWVAICIVLLFAAAFGQLVYHLSTSFRAIRSMPVGGERGFAPVMPPAKPQVDAHSTDAPATNQTADQHRSE